MKAYQIVCVGDPVSEAYAEISRQSYQPAIDAGIISEIIIFPAITPEHPEFHNKCSRYGWKPSMMRADLETDPDGKEDHSPTEKAGMCSHWELIKKQGISRERFLILEHDSFLKEECLGTFKYLLELTEDQNVCYTNLGLFMGCYTLSQKTAFWMYCLLTEKKNPFWINGGPYGCLERLFKTYTNVVLQRNDYFGINPTVIHPWTDCDTIAIGKDINLYYNTEDPEKEFSFPNPTTQVVSKSLLVTQHHHRYDQIFIDKPWIRHPLMAVID